MRAPATKTPPSAPRARQDAVHSARVESVAGGGAGVARLDGRVAFIPRTVPGDEVRFRITADKGKYLLGELVEILRAAPERRQPPCPHWSGCGGCPVQQMTPGAQATAKRRIFQDALERIGKMALPVPIRDLAPGTREFGYRMRARFQVVGENAGFFAPGTRRLVPIDACPLCEEAVNAALAEAQKLLWREPAARRVEGMEISSLDGSPETCAGFLLHPPGSRDGAAAAPARPTRAAWEGFSRATGFPLAFAGDRSQETSPAWTMRYELDDPAEAGSGLVLSVSPESFVQTNREVNRTLVRQVIETTAMHRARRVVDLFCGAGNFALPLARRAARVVGVEANPYAVRDAEANARALGLENARFLVREVGRMEAEEIVEALGGPLDAVLLDPPRKGALETVPLVRALAPPRVLYVSCNPATFARDARELAEAGYRIEDAWLVPMFPNTAHVETLTVWGTGAPPVPAERIPEEDRPCS